MGNELFEKEKLSTAYFRLSIPLVLSLVVTLIYNLADTFFVAQTGNTNLVAGVSLGAPVFMLLMAFGNIFGQGGSSMISRLLGQQDSDGVSRVSSFCFYAAWVVGLAVTVVLFVFKSQALILLGANEETMQYASDYYFWIVLGSPAIIASYVHTNHLRSEGLSKESMIGSVGGAVVNIILDPILISFFGLGAAGAAIASVIGYLFTDVFLILIVASKSRSLSMDPRKSCISSGCVGQIFGIGIPAAIVNVMQSVSVILVNQFLLPYGNDRIAAMGIVLKVSMIVLLVLTGLAFGGQPMFGYYFGSGNRKKLRELLRFCMGFISITAIILTAAVFSLSKVLMRAFIDNETIVREGTLMLRWQVVSMVFVGIVLLITIIFQSAGKVAGSFILSVSRQGVVFLAVLLIAVQIGGYTGIIAAQAIADVLSAILALFLLRVQLYNEFCAGK